MSTMNKIKYLLTLILCCAVSLSYAQKRISGNVFNPKDGPIMMANVLEIDANNRIQTSTTTDMSGNFSLVVKNTNNVLKVVFVGYRPWQEKIGNTTVFKIQLEDNARVLKSAQVTGRKLVKSSGLTIPEREVSVATQKLDMDEMQGLSFESADQALQGQIAGLDIVANSGNLGSGMSMRLRGVTTISGNQEPLIVVDGHILETEDPDALSKLDVNDMDNTEQFANLLNVNVEDIKTIDVKKDAGACAIWGSRGSNGVIEITTRRGARGKTKISGNYSFRGNWQPTGMKMLNGDGYTMMLKEAYFNPRQSDITSNIVELSYKRDRTAYYANYNKNTDWVDEITQFGQSHKYYVSLVGGGEQAQFRISGGYDHETGTIVKQQLDRLSTRMTLDYTVSDRIKFSSNFSLTYTDQLKNYYDYPLDYAYAAMPNMSVYRWEYDAASDSYYNTGEYFKMYPAASSASSDLRTDGQIRDGMTSYYLRDRVSNHSNPVAFLDYSWKKVHQYVINPQFEIQYKLMGKDATKTMLDYKGEVWMRAVSSRSENYMPAILNPGGWSGDTNSGASGSSRSLSFTTTHTLTFTPKLPGKNHSFLMLGRGELTTSSSNSQYMRSSGLVGGITDPTVNAYLRDASTSTSRGHGLNFSATAHYSYKSKYSLDATLRADGSTIFGKDKRWGYFPSVSGRWNISDEIFFRPLKKAVSMFSFAPGWGITGLAPYGESAKNVIYNNYSNQGSYAGLTALGPDNLRLTTVQWEKTSSWNLGFNLHFLEDLLMFNLNIYHKQTTELLQKNVRIPSSVGFTSLAWDNVGKMRNRGWDLNFNTKPILKFGKFSMKLKANAAQNQNTIMEMDASVLNAINKEFDAPNATESYMSRVQIGNALYSIYGFRYKGVYRYDYDHSGYFADDRKNTQYGENTAAAAERRGEVATTPVARDANGNIIFDADGNPLRMYYDYGGVNYQFAGGDAIYEDINHDGQINELDIVYLGNSNPTFNGGFGFDLMYGRWTFKTNFNVRVGAKIVNMARMKAEDMRSNANQCASVSWRWRKNGDITEIPRAFSASVDQSFNSLPSDRYVENSDFCRLSYMQLGYEFDKKALKRLGIGLQSLRAYLSAENLFLFTKYSGVEPERGASGWSPAFDSSQTPRARSFTFSLNFSF